MSRKTAGGSATLQRRLAAAIRERKMFAETLAEANARFT